MPAAIATAALHVSSAHPDHFPAVILRLPLLLHVHMQPADT